MRLPCPVQATARNVLVWPRRTGPAGPSALHNLTIPSQPPDTSRLPSGLQANLVESGSLNWRTSFPSTVLMLIGVLAVQANNLESGLQARPTYVLLESCAV